MELNVTHATFLMSEKKQLFDPKVWQMNFAILEEEKKLQFQKKKKVRQFNFFWGNSL